MYLLKILKSRSWIRVRNKSFRIHHAAYVDLIYRLSYCHVNISIQPNIQTRIGNNFNSTLSKTPRCYYTTEFRKKAHFCEEKLVNLRTNAQTYFNQ